MVGADWTYSAVKGWAAERTTACSWRTTRRGRRSSRTTKAQAVEATKLGCKTSGSIRSEDTSFYAVRAGLQKFNIKHDFEVKNIYEYYAKWIREGRLKVNSDWNKDLKIKFTVQDPCQIVRKSYGDAIADDLRFVVKSVVGEENFVDMTPINPITSAAAAAADFSSPVSRTSA